MYVTVNYNPSFIILVFNKQVAFVQYSDDAKTEFKLNTYLDKGVVLSAVKSIRYRGGNTKTGNPLCTLISLLANQCNEMF